MPYSIFRVYLFRAIFLLTLHGDKYNKCSCPLHISDTWLPYRSVRLKNKVGRAKSKFLLFMSINGLSLYRPTLSLQANKAVLLSASRTIFVLCSHTHHWLLSSWCWDAEVGCICYGELFKGRHRSWRRCVIEAVGARFVIYWDIFLILLNSRIYKNPGQSIKQVISRSTNKEIPIAISIHKRMPTCLMERVTHSP